MIPKEEYASLIRSIIEQHLPDEELIFDLEGKSIIDELYAGKSVEPIVKGATFRGTAAETVKQVAEAIPLIVATFQLLKASLEPFAQKKEEKDAKRGEQKSEATLAEQWEDRLKQAGLSRITAAKIAKDFSKDIARLVGGA